MASVHGLLLTMLHSLHCTHSLTSHPAKIVGCSSRALFERPLFPGLYLIIVNNNKTIIVPNNSLNPKHPIAVAQVKPQPKDQIRVLPFKLTAICRPNCTCLT